MNFSKKTLVLAVAGALFSGTALAVTGIGVAPPGNPSTYAQELLATSPLNPGAAADLAILTKPGVGYSSGFFLRIDLSNGATFITTPAAGAQFATDSTPVAVNPTIAGGGAGASWLVLSFLPNAGQTFAATSAVGLLFTGGVSAVNKGAISATITTYNGALPTPVGPTIPAGGTTVGAATVIDFQPGLVLTYTSPDSPALAPPGLFPVPAVADVAASPVPFSLFTESRNNADLGSLTFGLNPTPNSGAGAADNAGAPVTAAGMALASRLTVTGDFSARGSVTLGGVFGAGGCTAGIPGTATNTSAAWATPTIPLLLPPYQRVCYTVSGTAPIPASEYTATVATTPNIGFGPGGGTVTLNRIVHNGTELKAPLVQVNPGALTRLTLMNTGSQAYDYTVAAKAADGSTVTLSGDAAGGSIAAGKTLVVDLTGKITSSGAPRTGLVVTSKAPVGTLAGYYQLYNPNTGAVSNYVLVPAD